jgi:hypothetical protein
VTVAGAVPAADAARAAGWRIAALLRHCGNDNMTSVAATGPGDAWALGQPPWGGGPGCGADVEHWDGTAWRRVPVPRGVFAADAGLLAARSARDAWIFPVRAAHVGSSYFAYNYALHWDGTAWHASRFPGKLILQAAAVAGPAEVWAFGAIYRGSDTLIPDTARYDGRAWHRVRLPAEPLAAARGADDLWAIGPTVATAARIPRRQDIIALHWNGRTWSTLATPKLALPPGPASAVAASLTVAGPRSLWWYYQVAGLGTIGATQRLLHWDGTAWHAIALPAPIGRVDALTQDGHGGIWLTADLEVNFGLVQYWYHYNSGRWTRQRVPSPRGYSNTVFGMAWIPRTRSVWADGEADPNSSRGHTVGVIAKYGP